MNEKIKLAFTGGDIIAPFENDIVCKKIRNNQVFELLTTGFISGFLSGHSNPFTFVDIGAHIGYFSSLVAHIRKDVRIMAFEPHIENFAVLKENLYFSNNVDIFNAGILPISATKKIYFNEEDFSSSSIDPTSLPPCNIKTQEAKFYKFDEILTKRTIQDIKLIKIDVQAVEKEIFFHVFPLLPLNCTIICEQWENLNNDLEKFVNDDHRGNTPFYMFRTIFDNNLIMVKTEL